MKTTLETLLANPKSTFAGLAILAVAAGFLEGRVTLSEFLGAFAVLTAGGLLASKDAGRD